jgi:heptosyltransferase-2
LADRLSERTGGWILVFGSAADQPTATEILDRARSRQRIVDLTGRTSLVEAMALIGECDVFVTNDSGLMHVAAALHTPQVAIFGSTDHIRTGPYSEQAVVVRKELPCSPCKKPRCPEKHFRCMRLITSDEVFAAVLGLLEEG